jgi:hypothetical protein
MSHKTFRLVSSLFLALALSFSVFTPALAAPPANDNFATAEVITSLPYSSTVNNIDATVEPGEPLSCGSIGSFWYSFTPTQNMVVRLDMVGSVISGAVSIYLSSGSGFSNLTLLRCAFSDTPANFNVEAGKTYYLQVVGNGQAGVLQLNLQRIFPPANDNFANAEVITSLPFSATVDNTNATLEPGEPGGCEPVNGTTVWYSFTPAQNMGVRMNMLGSSVLGIVRLRLASGPGFSNLIFLGCMFFSGNSADFNVEAGKTYYLQVDTNLGETGVLHVNLQQISSGANEVTIDIKPGNKQNRIMIASRGSASVQVAMLSTADFDAPAQVDKNSLTFGATGDENSLRRRFLIGTPDCRARDVNRDRIKDLVCSFLIEKTGFKVGDTVGILKGQTVDGSFLEGRDLVQITAPSYPSYPSYP